jgi:hypothetical protein
VIREQLQRHDAPVNSHALKNKALPTLKPVQYCMKRQKIFSTMQAAPTPDQLRFQKSFNLSAGKVFRRKDLADKHPSVDRELGRFVRSGLVCKAAQGLYYVPKTTPFGQAPPDDEALVAKFLDDKRFLIFNPSSYNTLGLGTTQLYNTTVVYNHKRHGKFMLAGFEFDFREKPHFPSADQVTREFLLVDMLNNLAHLAEDTDTVLKAVQAKLGSFDTSRLQQAIDDYASVRTRRLFNEWARKFDATYLIAT